MKIAIFASAFYPHVGGVEELVRQLAHAYQDKGHEVLIITNRWPRDLPEFENYEGLPVHRFPMRIPEGGVKAQTSYRLTHSRICREMFDLLRERRIDVLHVQCISSNGYYALLAKRALGIPLVVTAQGELTMDAGQIYQRSEFMRRMLRELLNEADAITACSGQTLDELEEFYGGPFGTRARIVYNGISLSDFENAQPYRHERPYILGIGRLVPQKGFDVLLGAYAKSGVVSHDLIIAGGGPERGELECLSKELASFRKIDNAGSSELASFGNIHFVGHADRATAVSLFQGCELFVLPSRHEPMGIVNLEAMAAGKAVIASRVGGVPEIVLDGETGTLVPPQDPDSLAAAITQLASNVDARDRLGNAGRRRACEFNWPVIAEQYMYIYRTVARPELARCA